ncbi:MAG TPA: nuclear transport factor 2 family protein [Pyrinomonadaceae bacterium]|nr:nuclear transport factor 2 family protein [Pyrinomonadaceae bacterium]
MNKLVIRLLVAFVAFSFSLVLTSFIKPVRRNHCHLRVSGPPFDSAPSESEAEIRAIYREYGPAQTRRDREFFERIETEDFTLTVDGIKLTREEDIKWMENQPANITYESRVDHVRVFDHLAVAHGYLEVRNGDGSRRQWQFADVWVKRYDGWRIQSTTSR